MSFQNLIAFRYLSPKRTDRVVTITALFSLLGIALGVMTLIVVLSVMRGVHSEMIDSIIGLEGHVTVSGERGRIDNFNELTATLSGFDNVVSATPLVQGQVMASHAGQSVGTRVTGLREADLLKKELLTANIEAGRLQDFSQGVMIGSRMAANLGLKVGNKITLISPQGRATPAGTIPRVASYPVVAIFHIGMVAYDTGLVLMPFKKAQIFFLLTRPDSDGLASVIEVIGADANESGQLAQFIADSGLPDVKIYDWQRSNGHLLRAVKVQRNVMFLILTLIILVASFNIISSLIMLVRQKRRDIAILRTMGASTGSIMQIFLTAGCMVGAIGTALGTVFGLLIAFNTENIQAFIERITGQPLLADELYFLSHLPAEVSISEVLMVAALAMTLTFLATLIPARRAATLKPAEVLRGD